MTFRRIYEFAIEKCPQLAPRNTLIIHDWLKRGYDTELDIIPAIEAAYRHARSTIHSFAFFDGYIRRQNEKRIKEINKPLEMSQSEKDAFRAKNLRWHKERGVASRSIGPQDYVWLEQYEKAQEEMIL